MIISAVVKFVMSWELTAMPSMGIMGAAWATNVDFGLAALLNLFFIYRYVGFTLDVKDTLRTMLAAAFMGGVVVLSYQLLITKTMHNSLSTIIAISLGGGIYLLALLVMGGIAQRDVEKIPTVGTHLVKVLKSCKLLRG
jgi:stage V sporulation protein B